MKTERRLLLNSFRPRLWHLKHQLDVITPDRLDYIVSKYVEWRDYDEFIPFQCFKEFNGKYGYMYLIVKSCKRGNDVYVKKLKRKVKRISKAVGFYFKHWHKYTNALFITLTFDPKKFSLDDAWKNLGKRINLFIAKLRQRYGNISCVRTYEAHLNGYPHVCLIVIFKNRRFKVFSHNEFDKESGRWVVRYRVYKKPEIADFWSYGFVDIQGIMSIKDVMGYVVKYVTKVYEDAGFNERLMNEDKLQAKRKALLTLALCWFYEKRSYGVSHDLIQAAMRNSNNGSTKDSNSKWKFCGLMNKKELEEFLTGLLKMRKFIHVEIVWRGSFALEQWLKS